MQQYVSHYEMIFDDDDMLFQHTTLHVVMLRNEYTNII